MLDFFGGLTGEMQRPGQMGNKAKHPSPQTPFSPAGGRRWSSFQRVDGLLQVCYKSREPLAMGAKDVYIEHAEGPVGEDCSPGQIRDRLATVCVPVCILRSKADRKKDKGR